MTERLDSFASNDDYTQFGEAGIISHIFERIGVDSKTVVEFGAGDGYSCSNTARLWKDEGWRAILVEPDPERFAVLQSRAMRFPNNMCINVALAPTGSGSISQILADNNIQSVDFMSIDVDGDDYFLLKELTCKPRVICIEFNPTIPPHIELYQANLGDSFGASLLAIERLAVEKGYTFIGANYCNAFFVDSREAGVFSNYETRLKVLFPPDRYSYVISDFGGRAVVCGQTLPWGVREPYVKPLVTRSGYVGPITNDPQYIRLGFELFWGPAVWLNAAGLSRSVLREVLNDNPLLVCIDLTQACFSPTDLIEIGAEAINYKVLQVGYVLGFIHN